jgi:biopolymer transport protein ExbB/TolQ
MSGLWLSYTIYFLFTSAVLLGVLLSHVLFLREIRKSDQLHRIRLNELRQLIEVELEQSSSLKDSQDFFGKQKEETQNQLELIKLQLEALKQGEKRERLSN